MNIFQGYQATPVKPFYMKKLRTSNPHQEGWFSDITYIHVYIHHLKFDCCSLAARSEDWMVNGFTFQSSKVVTDHEPCFVVFLSKNPWDFQSDPCSLNAFLACFVCQFWQGFWRIFTKSFLKVQRKRMGTTNHSTRKETPRISGQEKVPVTQRESPVFRSGALQPKRPRRFGEFKSGPPNNPTIPQFFFWKGKQPTPTPPAVGEFYTWLRFFLHLSIKKAPLSKQNPRFAVLRPCARKALISWLMRSCEKIAVRVHGWMPAYDQTYHWYTSSWQKGTVFQVAQGVSGVVGDPYPSSRLLSQVDIFWLQELVEKELPFFNLKYWNIFFEPNSNSFWLSSCQSLTFIFDAPSIPFKNPLCLPEVGGSTAKPRPHQNFGCVTSFFAI